MLSRRKEITIRMKIFLIMPLCILFLAVGSVFAGPPYFTDDPESVELGHWEFYLASEYTNTVGEKSGTEPHIEANYGAFKDVQLHLIAVPAAYDRTVNTNTRVGFGDTELGVKYRFMHETDAAPQAGTFVLVSLPTGDAGRGLGSGAAKVFVPVWFQKSFERWTTYGGGGWWYNPGSGNRNWFYAGWLIQRDIAEFLTIGGEIFYRSPDTAGGDTGRGFTLGGQLNLSGNQHLLFSEGRDFSGPNLLTRYIAYQLTF